jgi:hypothetical protein
MDWRVALTVAAVGFLLFLVIKMRPVARRPAGLSATVKAARARAHAATNTAERIKALCDAGTAAAQLGRWTASAGFFLRAMRQDPTNVATVEAMTDALAERRPRLCEKILWRTLARMPWDAGHRPAAAAAARSLAGITKRRRDRHRAEVLRRIERELRGPE